MSKNGEWKPVGTIWRREPAKQSIPVWLWVVAGIIGVLIANASN